MSHKRTAGDAHEQEMKKATQMHLHMHVQHQRWLSRYPGMRGAAHVHVTQGMSNKHDRLIDSGTRIDELG